MDLFSIAWKLWRYKLVTLPVLLLTVLGVGYVFAGKQPVYEATSSYVLLNPPAPPTEDQIAANPALGRVSNNPYARFNDPTVVVEVLANSMAGESAQQALEKAGAAPGYEVTSASGFGYSSPIVKITAEGESPAVAIKSAELVGNELTRELDNIQQAKRVDPTYRIKAQQLDAPEEAERLWSGQLRMLIGVLGLGAVLLFIGVSVADALTTFRGKQTGRVPSAGPEGKDDPWTTRNGRDEGLWTPVPSRPSYEVRPAEDGSDRRPVPANGRGDRTPSGRGQHGPTDGPD